MIRIIRNIKLRENPIFLGRWNIDYCQEKIHQTIDRSNEDHCGACSVVVYSKNEQISSSLSKIESDNFSCIFLIE